MEKNLRHEFTVRPPIVCDAYPLTTPPCARPPYLWWRSGFREKHGNPENPL